MGLFSSDSLKGPVFLKDHSEAQLQLEALTTLKNTYKDKADAIEQELRIVQAGIAGEDQIRFELENSHIPMYVLHDLYLEFEGLSAQIDYFIVTHKCHFVIECKNLYGNIEITSAGDFIRTMYYGRHFKKEGLYSPITQNARHMELIKDIRSSAKSWLFRDSFRNHFHEIYRSIVVLANPKTILNSKNAKKEIRDQVIRADQLINYIRTTNNAVSDIYSNDAEMKELAEFFLRFHKDRQIDYIEKYKQAFQIGAEPSPEEASMPDSGTEPPEQTTLPNGGIAPSVEATVPDSGAEPSPESATPETILCPRCGAPMVKRVAAKGANAGREFYGCSRFPKCRGIVNIN